MEISNIDASKSLIKGVGHFLKGCEGDNTNDNKTKNNIAKMKLFMAPQWPCIGNDDENEPNNVSIVAIVLGETWTLSNMLLLFPPQNVPQFTPTLGNS